MQFGNILYSVDDGVATLTLNRPEVSNGFNIPMCEEILTTIKMVSEDESMQMGKSFLLEAIWQKCNVQ